MKKLWPVVTAVLIGSILAFLIFRGVESNTKIEEKGNAVAVQIGVFTNKENAEAMKESIGGIILEDDGLYRVYYSILRNMHNVDYITNYLQNIGVSYYLKRITVNEIAVNKIDDMETIMIKTNGDAKIETNKILLGNIKEVI